VTGNWNFEMTVYGCSGTAAVLLLLTANMGFLTLCNEQIFSPQNPGILTQATLGIPGLQSLNSFVD